MMKTLALWIFLLPVAAAQGATGEEMLGPTRTAAVGTLAPAATLETVDGKRVELGELYGKKPVYLKFWATWCVPCRQQMPHFEEAWQRYHDSVAVVAVNLGLNDDVPDVRKFLDKTRLSMPVAIDSAGDLAAAFGVIVTPMHVLIDADGRIAYIGNDASADLDRALEALSHSKPHSQAAASGRARVVSQARAAVGDKAPAFSLLAPGKTSKPTVIAFTTTWCESYLKDQQPETADACRKTRETLAQAYQAAPAQASWLTIASRVWSTEQDVASYRSGSKIEHPVALDATGEIFRNYGIKQVPTVVIVDADGTIRRRFDGFSPELAGELAADAK
jgi:peroxiredoxin